MSTANTPASSSSSTPPPPSPTPARVSAITVHWDPADRSLHTEAEYHYDGAPGPTHNVIDLAGWAFDYYADELQKLQPAVLLPGTDPLTVAQNVARVQHDFWWGRSMLKPQLPAQPPVDGTAPDISE